MKSSHFCFLCRLHVGQLAAIKFSGILAAFGIGESYEVELTERVISLQLTLRKALKYPQIKLFKVLRFVSTNLKIIPLSFIC